MRQQLMKREVRHLKQKSLQALVLSIELFNRPRDEGRHEAVLIHADHAFEMLLKAAIRHRGGRIRKPRESHTIGFKECAAKCLTDASLKCLTAEQAITLQVLNGWRDAAQHYLLDLSEQQLYLVLRAAVTLFDDILSTVFGETLAAHMPDRVLPVSTNPPADLDLLLNDEFAFVQSLIDPGSRQVGAAKARLRSIAILEAATAGLDRQPTEGELRRAVRSLRTGSPWQAVFPGVSGLRLETSGNGLTYSLRLTKKEGIPVKLVGEGDGSAAALAVRRVNELDFYCFGFNDLAERLGDLIDRNRLTVVVKNLRLTESDKYFREISIGRAQFKRYSQEALRRLLHDLPELDVEQMWRIELDERRSRRARRG
jgi:hypothetical protein